MFKAPSGGRAPRRAVLALAVLTLPAPVLAADIDFHRPHPGDGTGFFSPTLAPIARSRPEGSVIRIGPPSGTAIDTVTDGRVDPPMPRPGSEGSLPGGESGLVVVRQDVRELIDQVAGFYGFDTVLTRQVRGDVENERLPSDLGMFLDKLGDDRELVFYFRGRELNGSAREENVSRVIGLGPSDPNELRAAIEAAGVDADRFPVQYIDASNSVLVDGPPSFVGLVEVIAESLVRTERSAPAVTVIRGNQIERAEPDLPRVAPALASPVVDTPARQAPTPSDG